MITVKARLASVSSAIKLLGDVDLIICCIGVLHNEIVAPEKRLSQLESARLAEYFRINTILPALCLRYFTPLLAKQSDSRFVFFKCHGG